MTDKPAVILGPTRYGKAQVRVVHVAKLSAAPGGTGSRRTARHDIRDFTVSIALRGDQAETHLTGDNSKVLTTDAQKNAVYALAHKHGLGSPESFALLLGRHFLDTCPFIDLARVSVAEHAWERIPDTETAGGHSFIRGGRETRTAVVHCAAGEAHSVVSGVKDLFVLNTTGSEFQGFYVDEFTTLPPSGDRVLATEVEASWRHSGAAWQGIDDTARDWDRSYAAARASLLAAFADTYSRSLQQTLYAMGERLLAEVPEACEVRLSLPNLHHTAVDLAPFGLTNDNEVFHPADRPFGLIEGTVLRAGAPAPGHAWD